MCGRPMLRAPAAGSSERERRPPARTLAPTCASCAPAQVELPIKVLRTPGNFSAVTPHYCGTIDECTEIGGSRDRSFGKQFTGEVA